MKKIRRYHNMRKRKVGFYPDRTFLQKAVEEYLRNGGKISKIVPDKGDCDSFLEQNDNLLDTDEFLLGY